jgi:hypothetical protein
MIRIRRYKSGTSSGESCRCSVSDSVLKFESFLVSVSVHRGVGEYINVWVAVIFSVFHGYLRGWVRRTRNNDVRRLVSLISVPKVSRME